MGLPKVTRCLEYSIGHFQQALRHADAARGDEPAALADPLHAEREALADFAQDVVFRHAHVLEEQFRWPPPAHGVDGARSPARRDRPGSGHAAVWGGFVRSVTAKTIVKSASLPPVINTFSPLMTQSFAILDAVAADVGCVRACARLGHREARVAFALDGRIEIFLLLLLIGVVEDVVGVAAEAERHERAPDLGHDQRLHHGRQVHPAELLGRATAPRSRTTSP